MPGVWKKTLSYLGLVEDEEYDDVAEAEPAPVGDVTPTVRRLGRGEAVTLHPAPDTGATVVRTTVAPGSVAGCRVTASARPTRRTVGVTSATGAGSGSAPSSYSWSSTSPR